MAFVRNYTKTIAIPHEPGNTVTIRRPRRQALVDAANTRQEKALSRVRVLGGSKFLSELREAQPEAPKAETAQPETPATPEPATDPTPAELAAAYDQDALLLAGIVSWAGPEYDAVEVSADTIADLDPQTAQWLAEAIAVYATGKDTTRGNASRSSAA